VLSRCPRLRFGALSAGDVAEALMRDHDYAEADARAAAADADGSIGRALAAESVDLIEARETATRLLQQTARAGDPVRRLDAVKDLTGRSARGANERDQMAACLRAMASLLRDIGILATRADRGAIANTDLMAQLEPLTSAFTGDRSIRAYAAVDEALGALGRNASPKIVADWLILQL
jgi:DNA polymerase-3 subunit delta'